MICHNFKCTTLLNRILSLIYLYRERGIFKDNFSMWKKQKYFNKKFIFLNPIDINIVDDTSLSNYFTKQTLVSMTAFIRARHRLQVQIKRSLFLFDITWTMVVFSGAKVLWACRLLSLLTRNSPWTTCWVVWS